MVEAFNIIMAMLGLCILIGFGFSLGVDLHDIIFKKRGKR